MLFFDNLIVGAGFSGMTMAERLGNQLSQSSLVVEKRTHIGGNAYDRYDDHGVLIHNYGPHYFRTNSNKIKEYLSAFTEWQPVDYQILSMSEGKYWNFPINLNTFEQLVGRRSTSEEMVQWLESKRIPIENPQNSEEVILSQVGEELYKKFFLGYTIKQWKRHPRELDASVCGRIPIRTNRDDRYLKEEFQALPKAGYTRLFENILSSCDGRVKILYNADYREVIPHFRFNRLIFTGPIDQFFDECYGQLPYRSLRFENESFSAEQLREREPVAGKKGFWQPAMQVNYPNEEEFTRIVEVKHATKQACENTTIVREYPDDFGPGKEPYYPIPAPDAATIYRKYRELAESVSVKPELSPLLRERPEVQSVHFVGRLATYRYYNMDQVVGMALSQFEKIESRCSK